MQKWESEITEYDLSEYDWNLSKSKNNILNLVKNLDKKSASDESKILELNQVKDYKENLTKIFNEGESNENLQSYKNSVLNLLNLKHKAKSNTTETHSA
jgi:hypothetical protein